MSYILDALRKSEQERQRGKVPDFSFPLEPFEPLGPLPAEDMEDLPLLLPFL